MISHVVSTKQIQGGPRADSVTSRLAPFETPDGPGRQTTRGQMPDGHDGLALTAKVGTDNPTLASQVVGSSGRPTETKTETEAGHRFPGDPLRACSQWWAR
jgi:hypothetical protein